MSNAETNDNTYLNDTESVAEMVRLIDQDRTVTQVMGGLLPENPDFAGIVQVLDIACGPGGWVQEVAFAHPDVEVTGFDISKAMIDFARQQARVQGLSNAHFEVMDATKPLAFRDNTFDLVNARTIAGFMPQASWPAFIKECLRVTRPGGSIRLTETDAWGVTNSLAFETLSNLCYQALKRAKQGFSPDGRSFGITPVMRRLLHDAGGEELLIQEHAHVLNFSCGTPAYQSMFRNLQAFFLLVQPFLLKTKVTTAAEIEALYQQMLIDMLADDFCGVIYFLTVWAQKPL